MKNRASYMTGIRKLEMREIPVPEVKDDEVLVKIEYVGICGSDIHYLEHGRIGDFVVEGDFILGHEGAGTIVEVGSKVENLKKGDRVALEPGETCGKCEFCTTGRYNLCPDVEFLATPPFDGCFVDYLAHPAHLAFKLPDSISSKEGALIEPLSVGLEAASVSDVKLGDSVIILGSGTIGLMTMLACKARGASDITVVDVIPKRLEKAKELGADHVINAKEEDTISAYMSLTYGKGADIVIETAGATKTAQQTIYLVKRGGTITIVGMGPEDIFEFDFAKLMNKVVDIRSVFRYKNQYPVAIDAVKNGTIDISGVASHEFDFEDIEEAFRVNIEDIQDVVKVVIKM